MQWDKLLQRMRRVVVERKGEGGGGGIDKTVISLFSGVIGQPGNVHIQLEWHMVITGTVFIHIKPE